MEKTAPIRSVPRKAALGILTEVLSGGRSLDETIDARAGGVSVSDRAWLTELMSGVLRNLRRLDLAIDAYALKKKPTGKLRKILQIGAYQLIHQDRVFPATVVSETVDFVRAEEGEAPAKFANALLRRIAESRAEWRSLPTPEKNAPVTEKSAWANLPEWWWKKWEKDLGTQKAFAIAESALRRPELWFRFSNSAKPDSAAFVVGPVPNSAKLQDDHEGSVTRLPGFTQGDWIIQDLASQLLIERFSEILHARHGAKARLLDRCAAPGGKAVAMAWKGFSVFAADQDRARLRLVEENAKRTQTPISIIENDSEIWGREYDAVWIDAPCSGSGILRRHPDVRWTRKESDLEGLKKTQRGLLEEAFAKLPVGGLLFFSVCSLFREEGREHLDRLGWLSGDSPKAELEAEVWLTPDAEPSTDGFYGIALRKKN